MDLDRLEMELKTIVGKQPGLDFIFDLLLAYGQPKASIIGLEKGDYNLAENPGELLWKKKVFFKHIKSGDLHHTIDASQRGRSITKHHPRFMILTDFSTLLAVDTKTKDSLDVPFRDLPKHYDFFLPWTGLEKSDLRSESPADIKAAEKMGRLPLILAALTLVHGACLDLVTVIPDEFVVVAGALDAGPAGIDAGAVGDDTGAGREAGVIADGGGQPPVLDAGASPDAGGCVAQVEVCGDGLDNDCDGSTDEDDCTRVYEPNPACHLGDYRQYMTLCMRFEGHLDNEVRSPLTVLGHGDGEWSYVRAEEGDSALSFDGTRFVSIPVVETPDYVNDGEGMPTPGQAYTRSFTLAARLRPSLTASHALFSAHNDWDVDSEPSGPLDVRIVRGAVWVNAYYQDMNMSIRSVSVTSEPLPGEQYSHVIVRLGQDRVNPNSKRLLGVWVDGERVAHALPWTSMYPRAEASSDSYDLIGGTRGTEEEELSANELYRGALADLRVWNTAQPDGVLALEVGRWVDTFGGGRSEAWTCGLSDTMTVSNVGNVLRGRVPSNSACTRTLFERLQPVRSVAWTVACASDCAVSNQTERRHRVQLLPGPEAAIAVEYGDDSVQLLVGELEVTQAGALSACRFRISGGTRQRAPELQMAFDWHLRKGALTCEGLDNPVTFDLPEGLVGLEGVTLSTNSPFDLERFEWRLVN